MCPELSCEDRISERWQHPLSSMKGTIESHNISMWLKKILPIQLPVGHGQFCNCLSLTPYLFLLAFIQSI